MEKSEYNKQSEQTLIRCINNLFDCVRELETQIKSLEERVNELEDIHVEDYHADDTE